MNDNTNKIIIFFKGEFLDKNNNIQFITNDEQLFFQFKYFFYHLKEVFPNLLLFLQGENAFSPYWIMFECHSNDDDLFLNAIEWLKEKTNLEVVFQKGA